MNTDGNDALRKLVAFLHQAVPMELPASLDATTRIDSLSTGGLTRSTLMAAISRAANGLPREATGPIETLGDAAEWMSVKWQDGVPANLAAATADLVTDSPVTLRPVLPADVELMYVASTAPGQGMRWRFRGETPSFESFQMQLWSGSRCHFIAEHQGRPIAYLAAYDLSLKSRHCSFAILSLMGVATRGLIFDASLHFIDYVFRAFELRKVYIEVAEYNVEMVLGGRQTLFSIEGVLSDHEEWQGELWANYIGSVGRARWDEFASFWRVWMGAPTQSLLPRVGAVDAPTGSPDALQFN